MSNSCSDLHICLLPLLLHSPISTRLDCSAGLFSFRYGRNKLSYCPISSLLLKIRFCQKSVLLIIGVKISSNNSPCVVDSEWKCGKRAGGVDGWFARVPQFGGSRFGLRCHELI